MAKSLVILLHGLDQSSPYYATGFIKEVKKSLATPDNVYFAPIWYEDIVSKAEDALFTKMEASPLWPKEHMKGLRDPINRFAMDCLQWMRADIRQAILERIITNIPA